MTTSKAPARRPKKPIKKRTAETKRERDESGIPTPLLQRAERAVEIAMLMLGPTASARQIEDQAVGLMHVPIDHLSKMYKRLDKGVQPRRNEARKTSASRPRGTASRSRRQR
jgi:hypothetical protein